MNLGFPLGGPVNLYKGSDRISGLTQSDIRSMTIECIRYSGINLGQGLCETDTPEVITQAAQQALARKESNLYSSPEGVRPLRQKISKKLQEQNGIIADVDTEIVVTHGATGGYAATLLALLNPGDGILLFQPYYGYHVNTALLAQLQPQFVPFRKDLKITEADLKAALKPNTRAIVVCTPNNPSGKMITAPEVETIAKFAKENDLLVITDEMYEYFRYEDRQHISPASHADIWPRSVSLLGLSKTFSITGWRLGYLAAPQPLAEKIRLANDLFYVCATTPLQHAVTQGFDLPESHFESLRKEFQRKRDQLCEAMLAVGFEPIIPEGAYYILAGIGKFQAPDSRTFAMSFLESTKVAMIPGRAFFNDKIGEEYVRANFALQDEKLDEACKRIRAFKGGF